MNKINYYGPFKLYLEDFIEEKQALGYKYVTEALHMRRFDIFTIRNYPNADTLSKEIIMDWCSKKAYESQANLCSRASIMRQLAIHLNKIGIVAYIISKNYFRTEEKYIPYIYSTSELVKFFNETDKCKYCVECPYRHYIMPLFFRMVYTCGLRLSEARLLKLKDVDLINGILSIHHSKKDNSRFVPMSDEVTKRCSDYYNKVHNDSINDNIYFFPGINENPILIANIYKNFRRFLWKADISHRGRGHGPRIHDLRHTYAVNCLRKWAEEGKDLIVYLSIISYISSSCYTINSPCLPQILTNCHILPTPIFIIDIIKII